MVYLLTNKCDDQLSAMKKTPFTVYSAVFPISESPRWLLSNDQYQEAFSALETVRDADFTSINNELEDIKVTA